jgi:hypothetical protein
MEHINTMRKMIGVDVGYHESNIEPLNNVGRVGKSGIDKTFTLQQVIVLAHEVDANIIVKAGKNAKWYIKRFDIDDIQQEIQKQIWRNTSRATMWVIEWDQ